MRLVANMDPDELTIIGQWPPTYDNLHPLSPDSPADMTVVYCENAVGAECNTPCTLYNGPGNVCLSAPGTSCLLATADVTFCSTPDCSGAMTAFCNILQQYCPTHMMEGGYCFTPNTKSISVPAA
ncbi:hypothetical protein ONZ51_g13041 [Trametes cubensis]|uniref:Thaumatin-like protein n=1 Tax=Trametes cubensis TaxID=1111947 RepID=A0AAD7TF15_9APHY|nr:hypothetical protein ONZ51_g13041 [Trametes cubensis]